MERDFNDNDFERFLKENADQYRMFPSENVWKGIHNNLHTRRRWHGIGLALLLFTTGTVTWLMLTTPVKNADEITINNPVRPKKETPVKVKEVSIIAPLQATTKAPAASPGNHQKNYFLATDDWDYTVSDVKKTESALVPKNESSNASQLNNIISVVTTPLGISKTPAAIFAKSKPAETTNLISTLDVATETPISIVKSDDLLGNPDPSSVAAQNKIAEFKEELNLEYPLTIESVVNSFSSPRKIRKARWQLFITPTVTYRKLNENKQFISTARTNMSSPVSSTNITDLNNLVLHRPDIGLQIGASVALPISKKLSFVTGLQFNISKYDIKAYSFTSEIATIALSNEYGGTSTVSRVSNYRVVGLNGANKANWLRNFYYSAALPVGLEYKFLKVGKTYGGVSATMQPTYVLGNRAWVVSTDYKNYVEVPSLTRKWNFNAGIEAFAGFNVGKTAWRIGPQVRYQTMSSYKKQYPVKEHLFDYGLKLGILLNK